MTEITESTPVHNPCSTTVVSEMSCGALGPRRTESSLWTTWVKYRGPAQLGLKPLDGIR